VTMLKQRGEGMTAFEIAEVRSVDDPLGQRRVQVAVGLADPKWARMAFPYASRDSGWLLLPEVGDEVVVVIVNDGPIIIGSLYAATGGLPHKATPATKMFRSRAGVEIVVDDDKKRLELRTPRGACLSLDDDARSISLADGNGNRLDMTDEGIRLHSARRLELTCDGELSITSGQDALIAAKMALAIEAINASMVGKVDVKLHGSASASLTADGQTTVKGAMVMIN